MIMVIHKKNQERFPKSERVYIGRGSCLGNPFTSIQDRPTLASEVVGSRDESIAKYKEYLLQKIAEKDAFVCMELNSIYQRAQRGRVYLVCYCSPKRCHGDVIKELIDAKMRS